MACCGPKPKNPNNEVFYPKYHEIPLTEKFYSRYERVPEGTTPLIQKHEAELERLYRYDARCSYKLPRYTNQTYGWLPGYKIRILQNCDIGIHKSKAVMEAIKETYTKHINDPLDKFHYCSCNKYVRNKPCRYLKQEKKN